MTDKSMTDVAFEIMSKKKRAMQFAKLWADVSKATGADKTKVAEFYSDLTLDGRFAALKDNKWDLKTRRKFSESHIDLKKIEILFVYNFSFYILSYKSMPICKIKFSFHLFS